MVSCSATNRVRHGCARISSVRAFFDGARANPARQAIVTADRLATLGTDQTEPMPRCVLWANGRAASRFNVAIESVIGQRKKELRYGST
jgi:hypothetical protein